MYHIGPMPKLTINVFFISTENNSYNKRTQILLYPKYRSPGDMVLQKRDVSNY